MLPDAKRFKELISGRQRGPQAALWRTVLCAAEVPYRCAVAWRNRRFDRGRSAVHHAAVPVISVGNLTAGGTGKTPLVKWLAGWFRQRGVRVAIISRGYGAQAGARNDEALELEVSLPDVPHLQNPDRVAAAETAAAEFETQLIILDDAFQHRRIHRDLEIVLLDALLPFGYDHLLPRGLLREPVASLARADVIALSRADAVDDDCRSEIRRQAEAAAPAAAWIEASHRPLTLRNSRGETAPVSSLSGQRLVAFAGIGNPAGFRHTLDDCNYQLVELREFPDHHAYHRQDIADLTAWARQQQADAAVCTHKDLVKIGATHLGEVPLWALEIGIHITHGGELLEAKLEAVLGRVGVP